MTYATKKSMKHIVVTLLIVITIFLFIGIVQTMFAPIELALADAMQIQTKPIAQPCNGVMVQAYGKYTNKSIYYNIRK